MKIFIFKSLNISEVGGGTQPLLCFPDCICPPTSGAASSGVPAQFKNLGGTSGLLSEHRLGPCRFNSSVKQLPASWDWEENRTDSINMATHQQPNRRHIPFEMHRARSGQVNLSFTETRWETCNNNDNTSLTSLLPGLSGTFKIDNLIIYSPPGEREHLRACRHVVETFFWRPERARRWNMEHEKPIRAHGKRPAIFLEKTYLHPVNQLMCLTRCSGMDLKT